MQDVLTSFEIDQSRWLSHQQIGVAPLWSSLRFGHSSRGGALSHSELYGAQVLESLQVLREPESRPALPLSDPYALSPEAQEPSTITFVAFGTRLRLNTQADQLERLIRTLTTSKEHLDLMIKLTGSASSLNTLPGREHKDQIVEAVVAKPKTLASFVGRVQSVGDKSANVLLVNQATGERIESQCDTEVLRENGIGSGDEFQCEVVRSRGATSTRLIRLAPKSLPKTRVEEIRSSFKERWNF